MRFELRHDLPGLADALKADRDLALKALDEGLRKGAAIIERAAREKAPSVRGTLVNAIRSARLEQAHYEISVDEKTARYGLAVEEGSGPGGWPSLANLLAWMRAKKTPIVPNTPGMSQERLAVIIRASIYARGTPAQPYFRPALDDNIDNVEKAVIARLQAAFSP